MVNVPAHLICFTVLLVNALSNSALVAAVDAPTSAAAAAAAAAPVSTAHTPTIVKKYVGTSHTPVIVLDQVLPAARFDAIEKELRNREDYVEGDAYNLHFPGKVAALSDSIVVQLLEALANPKITETYPHSLLKREDMRGFASILCKPAWIHSDDMGSRERCSMNAVPPAAVFYFGFPNTNNINNKPLKTGTAFYREKISGLERLSSVYENETEHCEVFPESIVCWNDRQSKDGVGDNVTKSSAATFPYEEIDRIEGKANRLVLYPKDLLHNAWVENFEGSEQLQDRPLSCSPKTGRLAISLFFSSVDGGPEIVSEFDEDSDLKLTAKSRMFPITARKLFKNDDLFNFNDLNPKQIVPFLNSFPKARRYLADCPAFKKGKAYNIVNVQSCSLTKTTVVRDKETLRIRGSNDLVHPELDRGGSSNGETDVFDRHFVVSGQSELILKNLKLRGAWVGNTKIGFCSKCGYCRKKPACGNVCGWGPGGNNCCMACTCNSYGSPCTYGCANACDDTHRGGALRLEDNSRTILINIVFESNTAFGKEREEYTYDNETPDFGSGNIFATSSSPKLFLVGMLLPSTLLPSLSMGVVALPCLESPGLAQWIRLSKDSMPKHYYFHEVQAFGPGGQQYTFVGSQQSENSGANSIVNCYDSSPSSGNCQTGTGAWSMMFDLGSPKKVEEIKIYGMSDPNLLAGDGSLIYQRASGTKVSLGMEVDDVDLWDATFTSGAEILSVGDLTTTHRLAVAADCICVAGKWLKEIFEESLSQTFGKDNGGINTRKALEANGWEVSTGGDDFAINTEGDNSDPRLFGDNLLTFYSGNAVASISRTLFPTTSLSINVRVRFGNAYSQGTCVLKIDGTIVKSLSTGERNVLYEGIAQAGDILVLEELGISICAIYSVHFFTVDDTAVVAADCIDCSTGKWSSATGITSGDDCISCSAGKWSSATGITSDDNCTSCSAGKWSSATGITSDDNCTSCSAGKWSEAIGITSDDNCTSCSAGKWSDTTGITSDNDCTSCSPGKWNNDCNLGRFVYLEKHDAVDDASLVEITVYGLNNLKLNIESGEMSSTFDSRVPPFLAGDGDGPYSDCNGCCKDDSGCPNTPCQCVNYCFNDVLPATNDQFKGGMCHTGTGANGPWWISLDLGSEKCIHSIVVHNRIDEPNNGRILNAKISTRKSKNGFDVWSATFDKVQNIYTFDVSPPASACKDCSAGKWSNDTGITLDDDCTSCSAGKWSIATGITTDDNCSGSCSAGKWSTATGITTDDDCSGSCTAGKWSDATGITSDDNCTSCSAGKWSTATGITSDNDCNGACSPGNWSNKAGLTAADQCMRCVAGKYNDENGQKNCKGCGAGRWSNTVGLVAMDQCDACKIGKFSNEIGMTSVSSCKRCDAGLYNNEIGMERCKDCDTGRYNIETASTSVGQCKECEAGKYNEEKAQTNCSLCPKGTYSIKEGLVSSELCKVCSSGLFSSTAGATSCAQCPIGRALPTGSCPNALNHDSLEDCAICSSSTYQSKRGQEQCLDCPQGKIIFTQPKAAENHDAIEDCAVASIIPVPFDVTFLAVAKEKGRKNNGANTSRTSLIVWSVTDSILQAMSSVPSFHIELSKTGDFKNIEHKLEDISSKSRSHELNLVLNDPLWKVVLFGRVRVSTKYEGAGGWSDKSLPWITSDKCISSWLNDTSSNPLDWSCARCPSGAFCSGSPWFSVKAKFGYYRVPSTDIPANFGQCLYPGACLGAPNNDYSPNQYTTLNGSLSYTSNDFVESCNEEYGFQQPSRLCHTCRTGFRRHGRFRCATCPADGQNFLLLGLGVLVVTLALIFFIKMIIADAGRTKISESIQKIVINYAQVITIFGDFPLRWPPIIEGMFDFQGAISTVGEHLLNPDCVSRYATAAELYYSKQIAYTMLPLLLIMLCYVVWRFVACCTKVNFRVRVNFLDTTPKDKSIVSICVLLYLMYPTICSQALGLFNCMEVETGRVFLLADLEEECYTGRHLFMSLIFGLFQVIVYVIGLPFLGVYFMWRNHEHLDKHVVRTRYGLFLGGYRDARYYWEIMLVGRKVAIISMSVFGTAMKPETQTHVVLLFVLLAMLAESVGHPFDSTAGDNDRYGTPRIRYKTLHRLEMLSLFVIWLTLWCGLLIYQIDDIDSSAHIILSIFVFVINVMLMCWMVWKFIVENVYEFKHDKHKKKEEADASCLMKCMTRCTEKSLKVCPCLKEENMMERVSSMKNFRLGRIPSYKNFKKRRAMPLPPKSGRRKKLTTLKSRTSVRRPRLNSNNPFFGKDDDDDDGDGDVEMTTVVTGNGEGNNAAAGTPWVKVNDPETGVDYLYNEETLETKWVHTTVVKRTNPILVVDEDEETEEETEEATEEGGWMGWEKRYDEASENWYMYNHATEESHWI